MYLTQTDIAKFQLENNGNFTAGQALKELIVAHEHSDEKKQMIEGVKYYDIKNKILDHDFRTYFLDKRAEVNKNKSNNLIAHPYIGLLNDQKAAYMASQAISITADDKNYSIALNSIYSKKFDDMTNTLIVNYSNKGVEYIHPYINSRGEYDLLLADALEIIPIYDTSFQRELIALLRYYKVNVAKKFGDPPQVRYKLEYWDHEKVTYYFENENGEMEYDNDYTPNPKYHWYRTNKVLNSREGMSWGRVPFVQFKNNDLLRSDLAYTKKLIDDYDFQVSDMSNKLADVARLVWILQGYEGSDLGEFVKNLNVFGAVKVKEKGAVDTKSNEIPHDSHNSHLDRLEDNIFIFGRGVNMRKINALGNAPSQTALRAMYALLDLKCNGAISKHTIALEELNWFTTEFLNMRDRKNYDYKLPEYTFNKSMIINELDEIEIAVKSKGTIDDESILEKIPWVDDPQKILARLKKQKKENGVNLDDLEDGDEE